MLQEFCVVEEVVMDRKWNLGIIRPKAQYTKLRRWLRQIPKNFLQYQSWNAIEIYFRYTVHLVEAWSAYLSYGTRCFERRTSISDGQFSHFWSYQHFLCPTRVVKGYIGPKFRRAESWCSPMLWYLSEVGPRVWPPCLAFSERKLEYVAQDFNRKARDGRQLVSARF